VPEWPIPVQTENLGFFLIRIGRGRDIARCLDTIALSAVAVFVGQLVQALASLLEPFPFKTWKGKSSTLALTPGLGERHTSRAGAEINAATVAEGLRKLGNIGAVTWLRSILPNWSGMVLVTTDL
jgi:hypothetical protein